MSTTKQEYTDWCAVVTTNSMFNKQTDYSPQGTTNIRTVNHPYIKSNFSDHIEHMLSTGHKYTNIQSNLQIPHKEHNGPKLNTLEQFRINKHHIMHKNEILTDQIIYMTMYYLMSSR